MSRAGPVEESCSSDGLHRKGWLVSCEQGLHRFPKTLEFDRCVEGYPKTLEYHPFS